MYYLLEINYFVKPTPYRTSSLVKEFKFKPSRWVTGHIFGEPKEPIAVEFWENGGRGLAEILLDSIPLFSKELVNALRDCGVDNLQLFPVKIIEREGNRINQEYFAVNIVGLIKCADMEKSEYSDITGQGIIAVNFRKLIIDETIAMGFYIFRLAESVSSIIVHEKIKKYLDLKEFRYLSFRPLFEP